MEPRIPPIFGGPNAFGGIPDPNLENLYRWLGRNAPARDTVYLVGGEQQVVQTAGVKIGTLVVGLAGLAALVRLFNTGRTSKQKRKDDGND